MAYRGVILLLEWGCVDWNFGIWGMNPHERPTDVQLFEAGYRLRYLDHAQ
jgi:hypothetical protein